MPENFRNGRSGSLRRDLKKEMLETLGIPRDSKNGTVGTLGFPRYSQNGTVGTLGIPIGITKSELACRA